jgi:hypothetical protein
MKRRCRNRNHVQLEMLINDENAGFEVVHLAQHQRMILVKLGL